MNVGIRLAVCSLWFVGAAIWGFSAYVNYTSAFPLMQPLWRGNVVCAVMYMAVGVAWFFLLRKLTER